jgi:hypothetical protein
MIETARNARQQFWQPWLGFDRSELDGAPFGRARPPRKRRHHFIAPQRFAANGNPLRLDPPTLVQVAAETKGTGALLPPTAAARSGTRRVPETDPVQCASPARFHARSGPARSALLSPRATRAVGALEAQQGHFTFVVLRLKENKNRF